MSIRGTAHPDPASRGGDLRLAELVAAISLATDLGTGRPVEHALRRCLLAVRIARELGLPAGELRDTYYVALLRHIGCTAESSSDAAAVGGDEIAFYAAMSRAFMGEAPEVLSVLLRETGRGQPVLRRARIVLGLLADVKGAERSTAAYCEAARMLAARMGFGTGVQQALDAVFERWDGKGHPRRVAADAIPRAARIVALADDVELFCRWDGIDLAQAVLRRRRSRAYDPAAVDAVLSHGGRLLRDLEGAAWETVLDAEPAPPVRVPSPDAEGILRAFADFADLKSPFLRGHSTGVASLCEAAGRLAGLAEADVAALRRAALVHDLGRVGIPNGIWDKRGRLAAAEWERVRLHPYLTERILSRCDALGEIATIAGSHHERLDGSGYHRAVGGSALPLASRLLAAADAYHAMTEARPHRSAWQPEAAAEELRREAEAGRLDRRAVDAVLGAAGQAKAPTRTAWPAGLTDREVEVLRLVARGHTNRQIGQALFISEHTAHHHVLHIYDKIGVSTRAGAALFAMGNDLLSPVTD